MSIRELLAKRAAVTAEMRTIADKPAGEGGDLSAEQETRFGVLKTELAAVEKNLAVQTLVDEAERRIAGNWIEGTGDQRLDTALEGFSLRRAILSQMPGHTEDTSRERELSQELARREGRPFEGIAVPLSVLRRPATQRDIERRVALASADGAALIATTLEPGMFVDILRSKLVIRNAGATILDGLVGNLLIGRLDTSVTAGWVAENSALSLSDQVFNSVELTPKTAGSLSEFSRQMLLQSTPAIEMLLRNDMGAVLARTVDFAAIEGGGANAPSGILTQCPCPTEVASWQGVNDMVTELENANVPIDQGNVSWITKPQVKNTFRNTRRLSGSTDSITIMDDTNTLLGYPLQTTTNVPESSADAALILGDFSSLLIGYWSVLDVLVNPYETTAFTKGNVQVRAMLTCDVELRHIASFACRNIHPA